MISKNKKAFTIIELIVVIAIIGILVLFGMPKLLGYVEKAQLTRIMHDTKIMGDKMEGVLSEQGNDFNDWNNNAKDLGVLIMKKQLYDSSGVVKKLDKSHIKLPIYNWTSIDGKLHANLVNHEDDNTESAGVEGIYNETGLGGPLVADKLANTADGYGYKIIPDEYKSEIKTRLKGTFYSNGQGGVYYEHNKSIKSIQSKINPNCSTPEVLEYEFEYKTGTIIKYLGTEQRIIIPSSFLIEEKCWPVRIIGKGAFSRGYPYPRIKEVVLPPGLESIEDEAFKDNGIEAIMIPPGVENIRNDAFNDNPLEDVIIQRPENSINMGNNPFGPGGSGNVTYGPPNNKDLGLVVNPKRDNEGNIITGPSGRPGGSISYGINGGSGSWGGPYGNSGNGGVIIIPSVIIVDGEEVEIIEIDKGAFQGEGLIHVILPSGLQRIEDYAFASNQLIGVDVPQSVKYIGSYAFAYNELYDGKDYKWTLNYIDFEQEEQIDKVNKQVGNIEENGSKIDKLKEVSLLDHIWVNSNSGLIIPDDYGEIEGEHSKPQDDKVLELTLDYDFDKDIGKIVEYSGESKEPIIPEAFKIDGKTHEVKIIGEGAFRGKDLTKVTIANNVEIIEKEAFAFNKLIEVNLPTSIKQIKEKAFAANRTELSKLSIKKLTYVNQDYQSELDAFGKIVGDGTLWNSVDVSRDVFDILLADDRRYDHDYGVKGVPVVWKQTGTTKASIVNGVFNGRNSYVTTTEGKIHGKWYWEVNVDNISGHNYFTIGIESINTNDEMISDMGWYNADGNFVWLDRGKDKRLRYSNAYGISTISVLLDLDNNTIEFWRNGISAGKITNIAENGYKYYAQMSARTIVYTLKVETSTNFGSTPFKYNIPEGYKPYDYMNADPVNLK